MTKFELDDEEKRQIYLVDYDQKLFDWLQAIKVVVHLDLELPEKAFCSCFGPNWAGGQLTHVTMLELRMLDRTFSVEEIAVSGY